MLKKGDKVFFGHNGHEGGGYSGIAWKAIESAGLIPVVYEGIDLDVRRSNLDREIRDDFYGSNAAVILVSGGSQGGGIANHWAVPELPRARSAGMVILVYVTGGATQEDIAELGLPIDARVQDQDAFAARLRQDLERLIVAADH